MSDKEQNDMPKADDAANDEDLDNLSQSEKAAFEKIMAEISSAEDEDGEASSDETSQKEAPSPADPASETSADVPETSGVSDDKPTDDQQVALDQIMEDISTNQGNADPQANDQKAIEQESENQDDDPASEENDSDDDPASEGNDLDDDQQAALDKIMSEIKGGESEDEAPAQTAADEESSQDATDDDDLSDDQQDALDKIMSEIKGDDSEEEASAQTATDEESSQDTTDDEDLSDDQQAALDKIMSEIKGDDAPDETADGDASTDSNTEHSSEQAQGLSMDEFDNQLDSLLSDAQKGKESEDDAPPPNAPKPKPIAEDQSLEDINSALQDIVKEGTSQEESEASHEDISDSDDSEQQTDDSDVAILEEVDAPQASKKTKSISFWPRFKKPLAYAALGILSITLMAGSYWGYHLWNQLKKAQANKTVSYDSSVPAVNTQTQAESSTAQVAAVQELPSPIATAQEEPTRETTLFENLRNDIISAREMLDLKKDEILDLKGYYHKGIEEERSWLKSKHARKGISFKKAMKNQKTELGLRSIQRRMTYNAKLDVPLRQLRSYSEQLLYFERRAHLDELLDRSISGISHTALKRDGAELITLILKECEQLSIDQVYVTPPSLETIWKGLHDVSSHPKNASASVVPLMGAADKKISKAICNGIFENKYLLKAVSPQTATCLSKYSGMDMYLNDLKHLSPEAAEALSQWPGEWLSLNGIKTLSAEAARFLAKWQGKRLSLNGVTHLSSQATTYMSQWQGEQLEMVGLQSIGRWENYVTHLYLSESLRRKLQMQ